MKMIDMTDLLRKVNLSENAVAEGLVTPQEAAAMRNLYVSQALEPICERLVNRYILRNAGKFEARDV